MAKKKRRPKVDDEPELVPVDPRQLRLLPDEWFAPSSAQPAPTAEHTGP
jgi:hypothetical protein